MKLGNIISMVIGAVITTGIAMAIINRVPVLKNLVMGTNAS
jgi:hypothetical protein